MIEEFISSLEDWADSWGRFDHRRLNLFPCWIIWKLWFTDCGKPPILMSKEEIEEEAKEFHADQQLDEWMMNQEPYNDIYESPWDHTDWS